MYVLVLCVCTGSEKYRQLEAVHGDTVTMSCYAAPSSDVMWIQNMTNGYFNHVYENGTIKGYLNIPLLFSVVNASAGDYSLKIYNVQPIYSGLYDCYDSNHGIRITGYYLVAEGVFRNVSKKLPSLAGY